MAMEEATAMPERVKPETHALREATFSHTHVLLRDVSFQARSPSPLFHGGGLIWFPTAHVETTTASSWRVPRARGTNQAAPSYVSIISNRASNSCPQAVQRMQSDSTVNSSDLIPMPPQSGQRARWTL